MIEINNLYKIKFNSISKHVTSSLNLHITEIGCVNG
jgi:hypothetical protein